MITPSLSLDFTQAILDPIITFARSAATATRFNSSGIIETVAADTARFDFNPVTLGCRGLLIEELRANILPSSGNLSDATYWGKTNAAVNGSAATAPDGTLTASELIMNNGISATSADSSGVFRTQFFTSGTYTFSVFAKANGQNQIRFRENQNTGAFLTVNLTTGAISNGSTAQFISPSAVNVGSGWWRISFTSPSNMTYSHKYTIRSGQTGDGVNGFYVWGAQLEAGSFPTSYIPTTTTAVTRNADVATITGTNFSDFWQASKGGVLVRVRPGTVGGTRPWVQFDDGAANEVIALRGNTTNPELYIVDGGTPQAQLDAGTIAANTDYSMTAWWQTNDCKARLNNGAVVTDTSATIPTVTQARLGSDGTNYLNGHLASISYYDTFSGQIYTRRKNKAVFSLL